MCRPNRSAQAPLPKRFVVGSSCSIADNFPVTRASLVAPQEGNIKAQSWPCMSFFEELPEALYLKAPTELPAAIRDSEVGIDCGGVGGQSVGKRLLALEAGVSTPHGKRQVSKDDSDMNVSDDLDDDDDDEHGESEGPDGARGDTGDTGAACNADGAADGGCDADPSAKTADNKRKRGAPTAARGAAAKIRRGSMVESLTSPAEKIAGRLESASAAVAAALSKLKSKQ